MRNVEEEESKRGRKAERIEDLLGGEEGATGTNYGIGSNKREEREKSRRNNILIKGVDWKPEVSILEVNKFLKEILKLVVEVQNIRTLNTNGKWKLMIVEVDG